MRRILTHLTYKQGLSGSHKDLRAFLSTRDVLLKNLPLILHPQEKMTMNQIMMVAGTVAMMMMIRSPNNQTQSQLQQVKHMHPIINNQTPHPPLCPRKALKKANRTGQKQEEYWRPC
jgi:hypothetical protein